MRNFEERKAEVFRRSENRIKERNRKRNYIFATGIPLCVVLIVLSITSLPAKKTANHESLPQEEVYKSVMGTEDGTSEKDSYGYVKPTESFVAQYIRTNGYHAEVEYPVIKIIHSVDELREYYNTNKDDYDLERKAKVYSDTTIGFLDACDAYDEAYFENRILVIVLLEESSGSVRHRVDAVKVGEDERLYINISAIIPECGTDDMAQWHILIETEYGVDVADEEDVVVNIHAEYHNDGLYLGGVM